MDNKEVKLKLSEVTISTYQKALEKALNDLKSRPWEPVNNNSRSELNATLCVSVCMCLLYSVKVTRN